MLKSHGIFVLFFAVVLCALGYVLMSTSAVQEDAPSAPRTNSSQETPLQQSPKDTSASTKRNTDVQVVPDTVSLEKSSVQAADLHPYIIHANDPNPRVQSVVEAHKTGMFPERLSALHPATPFDMQAWKQNPKAYLTSYINIVEPGRVEEMMEPGPQVPVIKTLNNPYRSIAQLAVHAIRVSAAPNVPVSFSVTRGGIFTESKIGSVTVLADEQGVATVHYFAPQGVVNETKVLAASPFCFGQASLVLNIIDPALAQVGTTDIQKNETK